MTGLARPAVLLATVCLLLSGCTSTPTHSADVGAGTRVEDLPTAPNARFKLAAFDSCETALKDLRTAADKVVGPFGLPGMYGLGSLTGVRASTTMGDLAAPGPAFAAEKSAAEPDFSGT